MRETRQGVYFFYDITLSLAALCALPFAFLRALISPEFRKSLKGRLGGVVIPSDAQGGLLLHGVSVGEVMAMEPLVEVLRQRHPHMRLVISSSTPGGRESARRLFPKDIVVAYPLDFSWAVHRFLNRVQPSGVGLLELEVWPNFLRGCHQRQTPVIILNGRVTKNSVKGYRRVGWLLPRFDRLAKFGAQNELYQKRFEDLGVPPERISVTGNLKFDRDPKGQVEEEPWGTWLGQTPSFALASTHEGEERLLLEELCGAPDLAHVRWVVVPRHPPRAEGLFSRLTDLGRPVFLRSALREQAPLPPGAILIVDTFGELSSVYAHTFGAFVGGSFIPHGGQNVLEPAALKKPIAVGPHTANFADEIELLSRQGGLVRVENPACLVPYVRSWCSQPSAAAELGEAAFAALATGRGAALRSAILLEESELLPAPPSSP